MEFALLKERSLRSSICHPLISSSRNKYGKDDRVNPRLGEVCVLSESILITKCTKFKVACIRLGGRTLCGSVSSKETRFAPRF